MGGERVDPKIRMNEDRVKMMTRISIVLSCSIAVVGFVTVYFGSGSGSSGRL